MKRLAYRVLSKIYQKREISLEQFLALFPRERNDHRDFYVAASLIKEGFIGRSTETYEGTTSLGQRPWSTKDEMALAIDLHFARLGQAEREYRLPHSGHLLRMSGRVDDPFFCTAKTDLLFEERRKRSIERWFAIFIALFAASATALLGRLTGL